MVVEQRCPMKIVSTQLLSAWVVFPITLRNRVKRGTVRSSSATALQRYLFYSFIKLIKHQAWKHAHGPWSVYFHPRVFACSHVLSSLDSRPDQTDDRLTACSGAV